MTKGVGKKLSYNPTRRSRGNKKKEEDFPSETHDGHPPSSAGGDEQHDGDALIDRVLKEQEDSLPVLGMMSSDMVLLGSETWAGGLLGHNGHLSYGKEENVSQQIHVEDEDELEDDEPGLSSTMDEDQNQEEDDEDAVMEDSVGETS